MVRLDVPPGSTADVDTWAAAQLLGVTGGPRGQRGPLMKDEDEILREWVRTLLDGFDLTALEVDIDAVLHLAADAAHKVIHPAAPLATFVAGYAAGLAAGSGQAAGGAAMRSAIERAGRLAAGASGQTY
jgi:hypothetical protein